MATFHELKIPLAPQVPVAHVIPRLAVHQAVLVHFLITLPNRPLHRSAFWLRSLRSPLKR